MTGLMIFLTVVTSAVAAALLALVIYGFRRYINRVRTSPIDFIATGILLMAFSNLLGFFWWEILPMTTVGKMVLPVLEVYSLDWTFNILLAVGAWNMLKGFHMLVEEREPGSYHVLTAVFYPRRLRLWIGSRTEEE